MSSGLAAVHGLWIEGRVNEDKIFFHLCSDILTGKPAFKEFKALERGEYYRVQGRIIDGRICESEKAITLVVNKIELVPDRAIQFSDLVDRISTFSGTAAPQGMLLTDQQQRAFVEGISKWPESVAGKPIVVRGTFRQRSDGFRIEQATWHPLELKAMLGQRVSLEGVLWGDKNIRFMEYEKQFLYLAYPATRETMFLQKYEGKRVPVRVTGTLVREERPVLKWSGPDLEVPFQSCYVIRDASLEYLLPVDFHYDRYKPIYSSLPRVSEGVPELIAEYPPPANQQFNPAPARMYARRNEGTIKSIIAEATPDVCNILAKRMQDSRQNSAICKIYAAMLAHLNDQRGRSYLIDSLQNSGQDQFPDTLFCLGEFPFMGTEKTGKQTDVNWVEDTLIQLMKSEAHVDVSRFYGAPAGKYHVTKADAAMLYSRIYLLLIQINSRATHKILMDYVLTQSPAFKHSFCGNILVSEWLDSNATFSVDDLLLLETIPDMSLDKTAERRKLYAKYLQEKHYQVVERILQQKDPYQFYSVLRNNLTPEVVEELRNQIKSLQGDAKDMVEQLLILSDPDPVPLLIKKLETSAWKKNHIALYELKQSGDRRAVKPVIQLLRTAPREFFDLGPGYICDLPLQRALEVIEIADRPQQVHEYIELLSVDLARSDSCLSREYYQREIALRLILLTGESYGVDQTAWRAWEQSPGN
ncbi:hypothetical protein [Gimesia algae]|nr:hypothetical protein [Gimesia algae]